MSCNQIQIPLMAEVQIAECRKCKWTSRRKRWCGRFGIWIRNGEGHTVLLNSRVTNTTNKIEDCCGKGKSLLRTGKDIVTGYKNLILNHEEKLSTKRMLICKICDKRRMIGNSLWCQICNCFMKAKTRNQNAKCKLGKW